MKRLRGFGFSNGFDHIINSFRNTSQSFGCQNVGVLPVVEPERLFSRALGVSDVVTKEMFRFTTRGGEPCVLRPEATASIVREWFETMKDENERKLCYDGSMFRYERPQRGRMRQFHQFGLKHQLFVQSIFSNL